MVRVRLGAHGGTRCPGDLPVIRRHSPNFPAGEPSVTREREGVPGRTLFSSSDLQKCACGVFLWSRFFYNGTGRGPFDAAAEDRTLVKNGPFYPGVK